MDEKQIVKVSKIFQRNFESSAKFIINQGGARSTKSWSIAQLLVQRFWNIPKRKILVSRKTGPALTRTAYKLVVSLLSDYGFLPFCEHNKTENTIRNKFNGAEFEFISIDNPEKIKSTEYNDIWMEEATEFTFDDFIVLQTRLSGPTDGHGQNQIFFSFNPTDENGWIEQKLVRSPVFEKNLEVIHSTYHDNPFLSNEYISVLESLKEQDYASYQVFALGEYGVLSDIIYNNFTTINVLPESFDEVIYGLDFGFNNPSALIRVGIKDGGMYLQEMLYQTGLTNGQLVERLPSLIPEGERDCPIYADCAEPDRIQEIANAGFNVIPADKEVKIGIDFCKRQKFFTTEFNVNLNRERSRYKWRQDKNGNTLDEPVKFDDHIVDSLRYSVFSHFKGLSNQPGLWVLDDDKNLDQ